MKIVRHLLLISFLVVGYSVVKSQTNPHLSFYRYNWQLANPAAMTKTLILKDQLYYVGTVSWRQQWNDIEGAPRTGTASFEYRPNPSSYNYRMGVNTVFDNTHAISTNGAYFNYTYFTTIGHGHVIQAGFNAGIIWYRVNADKLKFVNSTDPTGVGQSQSFFEVGGGVVYRYLENFYVGLSYLNGVVLSRGIPSERAINRLKVPIEIERTRFFYSRSSLSNYCRFNRLMQQRNEFFALTRNSNSHSERHVLNTRSSDSICTEERIENFMCQVMKFPVLNFYAHVRKMLFLFSKTLLGICNSS